MPALEILGTFGAAGDVSRQRLTRLSCTLDPNIINCSTSLDKDEQARQPALVVHTCSDSLGVLTKLLTEISDGLLGRLVNPKTLKP